MNKLIIALFLFVSFTIYAQPIDTTSGGGVTILQVQTLISDTARELRINMNTIYQELLDSISSLRQSINGSQIDSFSIRNLAALAEVDKITLTWLNPLVFNSIQIEKYNPSSGFVFLSSTTNNSYVDYSVVMGNTYTYRLKVFNQSLSSVGTTIDVVMPAGSFIMTEDGNYIMTEDNKFIQI